MVWKVCALSTAIVTAASNIRFSSGSRQVMAARRAGFDVMEDIL
jgi:hypothetical protein